MGKVVVVGIGPGHEKGMTGQAIGALQEADVLCGYTVYIELVRHLVEDKPLLATGMTREVERCHAALEQAVQGKNVAVVCSGDAGVYGMAGAAVLGAPLMHDFAVISLSDLLTPWQTIQERLFHAASGDFVICLYNPASKGRKDHLAKACDIILPLKDPQTVCGWVRNIGREGQQSGLLSLAQLRDFAADMFTTIYIGNSATMSMAGKMVTPRGYEGKK